MHGVLVVDKPTGLSSAAAVHDVKRMLQIERAGHGGTLDPLATGVLPVCLNAATKLAQFLLADDKAYEATGVFGVETDTLDRTGRVTSRRAVSVTESALRAALSGRVGEQDQVPPMFSAIKQAGVRLYHRARAGEQVERTARRIRIDRLELIAFDPPQFRIAIACGKGTYVRSLLADLGTELGCGAHLTELRRTRSGRFTIEDAIPLAGIARADLAAAVIPLGRVTALPTVIAQPHQVKPIRSGLQLPSDQFAEQNEQLFQIVDEHGTLVAIAHAEAGRIFYDRVFPDDATS